MTTIQLVLAALGAAALGLSVYASAGALFPFVAALSSVRIRKDEDDLEVRALDAEAMVDVGYVVFTLAPLASVLGWLRGALVVVGLLLFWSGFRLRLRLSSEGVQLTRLVFWLVPWRTLRARSARLFVDGWGDFMDPEALVLSLDGDAHRQEIGWSDARSGDRATRLANEVDAWLAARRTHTSERTG